MASSDTTRLGGRTVAHHGIRDSVEAEYDRLRDLARTEARLRNSCFDSSKEAYASRDGKRAKELSEEGKRHAANMQGYNQQASEHIFRENNAQGRVDPDCIDLHGQFVEEAEVILETRIRADIAAGQTHLRAIVGKGNHSAGHVQRLKPKVEEICSKMRLSFRTEDNDGRIYIDLTGGQGGGWPDDGRPDMRPPENPPEHRPGHGGQGGGRPDASRPDVRPPRKERDESFLGSIFRKIEDVCCVVM